MFPMPQCIKFSAGLQVMRQNVKRLPFADSLPNKPLFIFLLQPLDRIHAVLCIRLRHIHFILLGLTVFEKVGGNLRE